MMQIFTVKIVPLFFSLFFLAPSVYSSNLSEEEIERWLSSDDLNPPRYEKVDVNDGELYFLSKKPNKPVHHHSNTLTILKNSLDDGWVKLVQCHVNMDRVPRVQVMFNKKRVRDIKIIRADAIEKSWVEKNTVQLENVKDKAVLCIEAWTKALVKNSDGTFKLTNGPFMRKFLDGYYPIHVTIDVDFKATNLTLVQVEPIAQ